MARQIIPVVLEVAAVEAGEQLELVRRLLLLRLRGRTILAVVVAAVFMMDTWASPADQAS
jgi:putative Ca2+/H+ antiporter (TMEM165/GDT1 family)